MIVDRIVYKSSVYMCEEMLLSASVYPVEVSLSKTLSLPALWEWETNNIPPLSVMLYYMGLQIQNYLSGENNVN